MNRREWLESVGAAFVAGQVTSSGIEVQQDRDRSTVVRTAVAEFRILPSGRLGACLLQGRRRFTLDEAAPPARASGLIVGGKEVPDGAFAPADVKVLEAPGKLGARGKRVEIRARTNAAPRLERTLAVEIYEDFPAVAVVTSAYKNVGTEEWTLDQVSAMERRLAAAPGGIYSFHGSSGEWGKDDIVKLSKGFARENLMGAATPRGQGGGVPVVAFWTGQSGQAIGHIESLPFVCSFPVTVGPGGNILASMLLKPARMLKPGDVFSLPRGFVAVFAGDFYAPLRLYASMLQREGWTPAKPSSGAYEASWCGWGYEFDVTPAQMLGTVPKLKEFGIRWATLDDRWFATYGDWEPRPDTFPGDAIQKMVEQFHRQGISIQIWWRALAAEDGQGRYNRFQHKLSKVVAEHPDWLILNRDGKDAKLSPNLPRLCPALTEVKEYQRKVTVRFIRDWGFDGHKLDNAFTVPPCFNPRHQHRFPEDSIAAVGEAYRAVFDTTRALKPQAVIQICACGTPPNYAWLPYLDQAVTGDPVGSRQVRLRIKMLKALLGPEAAVYGDHVELTEIRFRGDEELDLGEDFASTIGAGGVVGTKFVWPDPGRFKEAVLTPGKEAHWKEWIGIYNARMLSRGTFLDLYRFGFDVPEGYAIAKDGKLYYAFFGSFKGVIELRGLGPGKHHVVDYVDGKDFGTVSGPTGRIAAEFDRHLLLEASPSAPGATRIARRLSKP